MELMGDKNDLPKQDQQWARQAWAHLSRVRQQSPLIQCITNFVSMDFVANVMLAAGASPAMIHSIEEIPDFTPKAHALYINVGTLTPDWLPAMKLAIQVANENKKPWVLDPVAAGASGFRLKACLELLGMKPAVVRGNGSEIIALFKGSEDSDSKVNFLVSNLVLINVFVAFKLKSFQILGVSWKFWIELTLKINCYELFVRTDS